MFVAAVVGLASLAGFGASNERIVLGVWYEGGVGAFRHELIPEDPVAAAALWKIYGRLMRKFWRGRFIIRRFRLLAQSVTNMTRRLRIW